MGTINRQIAEEIAAGKYKEDRPTKIVTYNNMFDGEKSFAVVCEREDQQRYEKSPACSNVKVWWTKENGRTLEP
jgi:hypothetical protein